MKVAFFPEALSENHYLALIQQSLGKRNVEFIKVNQVFRDRSTFRSVNAVHFNWYESISEEKQPKAFVEFLRKCAVLLLLWISRKRIVWTMHNKQEHEGTFSGYYRLITWLLVRLSTVIIIHSRLSEHLLLDRYGGRLASKIRYIPHPHYIGAYGKTVPAPIELQTMPLRLLFLGAVRPYKNIELLIDVVRRFGNDVSFTIAGKPLNISYEKAIAGYCSDRKNICLQLRFIQDEQIPQLIGSHDLLVLPYNVDSSLNSGSVILAASYGRSFICPEIGTVLDFEGRSSMLTYQYANADDHVEKLTQAILTAISLKREQPDVFVKWGKVLLDEIQRNHHERLIAARLYDIYTLDQRGQ